MCHHHHKTSQMKVMAESSTLEAVVFRLIDEKIQAQNVSVWHIRKAELHVTPHVTPVTKWNTCRSNSLEWISKLNSSIKWVIFFTDTWLTLICMKQWSLYLLLRVIHDWFSGTLSATQKYYTANITYNTCQSHISVAGKRILLQYPSLELRNKNCSRVPMPLCSMKTGFAKVGVEELNWP